MGWNIAELDNTVVVDDACAKDLFEAQEYEQELWYEVDEVADEGQLMFIEDHMEHMDYLWREHIQAILQKHNVEGTVTFGSLEGDNAGSFWGYQFDGKGGMEKIKGTLSWKAA